MPRLVDPWFSAKFYGDIVEAAERGSYRYLHEDGRPFAFSESQGLWLWCPCGYGKPQYPIDGPRPHAIVVPFANPPSGVAVPPSHGPISRDKKTRPRWRISGSSFEDITLEPSIDVGPPNCWHGHIQRGEVR